MVWYFSNYVVTFKLKKMFFVCGFACECSANKGEGIRPRGAKVTASYGLLDMVLRTELSSSGRAAKALNCWAISWALILYLLSYNFQIFFPIKINFYVACMCVYTVHTHCLGWKLVDHKYMCLFMCSLVCSISLFLRQFCVLRSPVLLALCFLLRIVLAIPSLWAQSKF